MSNEQSSKLDQCLAYFNSNNLTPRINQRECLDFLLKNDDKDFFILNLPTGTGKSFIPLSLGEIHKKILIVTSTNQLIEQYLKLDKNVVEIKGAGNYKCAKEDFLTCAEGPCKNNMALRQSCIINSCCPHINQLDAFKNAKKGLTNYSFVLSSILYGIFSEENREFKYDWVIFDEGHNIEQHMIDFATIKIDYNYLIENQIIPYDDYIIKNKQEITWVDIINSCKFIQSKIAYRLEVINFRLDELKKSKKTLKIKKEIKKSLEEKSFLDKILTPFLLFLSHSDENNWIYEPNSSDNTFKLTPINAGFIFNSYLKTIGKKFIFMSATIGDQDVFKRILELEPSKTTYFECDSPFPAKASPVVVLPKLNLSYTAIDNSLEKCLQYVEAISSKHKEGGIIHTANYKIATYIYNNCNPTLKNRLVCKEKYKNVNNSRLVEIHEENIRGGLNSILLSPSMIEGLDLIDDLSRWQIIIKLPFASLGDGRVNYLANKFKEWYVDDVVKKIIQACGRSTRTENDWSITYILDKTAPAIFEQIKLPIWFKNRLIFK